MLLILGIDPGLNNTGWGVIKSVGNSLSYVDCGTITTDPKMEISHRLYKISSDLTAIIENYKPDTCGIEETFVNKNAASSLKLGQARGALLLTVSLAGLPIKEYAATLVKKSIVGVGRADKDQVAMMVKQILPGAQIPSADAADALAIAICHANHAQMQELVG